MYALRGAEKKERLNITLDRELVRKLREEIHEPNLSGLIDRLLCAYVAEKLRPVQLECPCGVIAAKFAWNKWAQVCPKCKRNHGVSEGRKVFEE